MAYRIEFTDSARSDLLDITRYIKKKSGRIIAKQVLTELTKRVDMLREFPERGNIPKELVETGQTSFRELHYKPYRIFFAIDESNVTILLIADGRRDMRTLLRHRLLND